MLLTKCLLSAFFRLIAVEASKQFTIEIEAVLVSTINWGSSLFLKTSSKSRIMLLSDFLVVTDSTPVSASIDILSEKSVLVLRFIADLR